MWETVRRFGRLDCAFNNAGIAPKDESRKPIGELAASAFDLLIAVHVRGVFLCMKHELREMVRAGKGATVNTASIAGIVAEPGVAGYVAARHGVIGLTKAAAARCFPVRHFPPGNFHPSKADCARIYPTLG